MKATPEDLESVVQLLHTASPQEAGLACKLVKNLRSMTTREYGDFVSEAINKWRATATRSPTWHP